MYISKNSRGGADVFGLAGGGDGARHVRHQVEHDQELCCPWNYYTHVLYIILIYILNNAPYIIYTDIYIYRERDIYIYTYMEPAKPKESPPLRPARSLYQESSV